MYDFELPPCEAVTALGEVLSYVAPDGAGVVPLRAAGFSVRVARRYGRMALPPRRLAFVARKAGGQELRRGRARVG